MATTNDSQDKTEKLSHSETEKIINDLENQLGKAVGEISFRDEKISALQKSVDSRDKNLTEMHQALNEVNTKRLEQSKKDKKNFDHLTQQMISIAATTKRNEGQTELFRRQCVEHIATAFYWSQEVLKLQSFLAANEDNVSRLSNRVTQLSQNAKA